MSLKALPILVLNLGGEMMYVLDQRLKAQGIEPDKASKVMNEIMGTMLSNSFVEEMFKPQELYTKRALRTVFEKLAHSSIMRLNTPSMDKLYDLMTMTVKYQVYMCTQPSDLLLITLNHMDSFRSFTSSSLQVQQLIANTYTLLMQHFRNLGAGSFQLIRHTLLNFFQDVHIRVSLFLREQIQLTNGHFVTTNIFLLPPAMETPGTVRIYNEDDGIFKESKHFEVEGEYSIMKKTGSLDLMSDRVTKLGLNMYETKPENEFARTETITESLTSPLMEPDVGVGQVSYAKEEIGILADLLGQHDLNSKHEFRLNLFGTDNEEEVASVQKVATVKSEITFDAHQVSSNDALLKLIGEMSVEDPEPTGDADLLELMDLASK